MRVERPLKRLEYLNTKWDIESNVTDAYCHSRWEGVWISVKSLFLPFL
jgi:hypothetical protein